MFPRKWPNYLLAALLRLLSKNQLNQKFKLMVKTSDMWYILTCTLTPSREPWAKSVDATQTLLIRGAKYSTLNEGWLRFEPMTSCHAGSDTMSRSQLNQKFKLMVDVSKYVIYSNTYHIELDSDQILIFERNCSSSSSNSRWWHIPKERTMTMWLSVTVGTLCAKVITVHWEKFCLIIFCRTASVADSMDAVASSSTKILFRFNKTLPWQNNCLCPALQFCPSSFTVKQCKLSTCAHYF